ncbi:hypothetical protein BDV32DRAFT_30058 [Aspergillus pseudonomiae]|nr:hypothetical protein BDV32DRAFT_30058 [Aspergillus pseudonomiae]
MSHPYLCPSARLCNSGSSVGGRDIRRMDVTFYLLAHGGQIDVLYFQSVNEEALMCRLSIPKNKRIRKQRLESGLQSRHHHSETLAGHETTAKRKRKEKKKKMKFNGLILIDLTGLYEISSFIYLKSYPTYPWNWYISLHKTKNPH